MIEQKIREIIKEVINDNCCADNCGDCGKSDCKTIKDKAAKILALFGPAEGELAACPNQKACPTYRDEGDTVCLQCVAHDYAKAQLAADKAMMVKLPNVDELIEMMESATEKVGENKPKTIDACFYDIAHELLKLLRGQA